MAQPVQTASPEHAKALLAAILLAHAHQQNMQGAMGASKVTANGNGQPQQATPQMPNKIEVHHVHEVKKASSENNEEQEDDSPEGKLKKITEILSKSKKSGEK